MKWIRWLLIGAFLAALGISGGSLMLESRRQRAAQERAERARLTAENQRLLMTQARLEEEKTRLEEERRQLEAVVERLNVERRVARIEVLQQHRDPQGHVRQTVIRMTEIAANGKPLPALVFGIAGEVPHFDALVIKFDEDYVAEGDPLRGKSLALFRRVYGESQAPEAGYWLGRRGEVPDVYRVNPEPSEFEIRLWGDFWSYAANPEKARAAGVRVAQGEAVYAPMKTGEHWTLTLEADGGLNLVKQETPASPPTADQQQSPSDQRLAAPSPLKDEV